jgi:hypothetical protein
MVALEGSSHTTPLPVSSGSASGAEKGCGRNTLESWAEGADRQVEGGLLSGDDSTEHSMVPLLIVSVCHHRFFP